ncbi:hypothetical protein V8C42DRAFT_308441 [Trichoderma barbatum]
MINSDYWLSSSQAVSTVKPASLEQLADWYYRQWLRKPRFLPTHQVICFVLTRYLFASRASADITCNSRNSRRPNARSHSPKQHVMINLRTIVF